MALPMTLSASKNILTYSGSLSPPFVIIVSPNNNRDLISYSPTTFTVPWAVYNQAILLGSPITFTLFQNALPVSNQVDIYPPVPGIPVTGIHFLLPQ